MIKKQKEEISTDLKRNIKNDIILAIVITVIAVAGLVFYLSGRQEGTSVAVKIDGKITDVYPLSENRELVINTGADNEHENILVINDGKAYIKSADCPDSICVKTRAASYVGQTIVCLPHKLVVEIVSESSTPELDVTI